MMPFFRAFLLVALLVAVTILAFKPAHAAESAVKIPAPLYWIGAESCDKATVWIIFQDGTVGRMDKPVEQLREFVSLMAQIPHSTVTFPCRKPPIT